MVVAIIFMVSVVMVFMVSMSSSVLIVIVHGGIHYDVRGDSPFNGVHEQNLKKKKDTITDPKNDLLGYVVLVKHFLLSALIIAKHPK